MQQRCKFYEASLKKGRWGSFLASKELFSQGVELFLQQGRKIAQKGPLFEYEYEHLCPLHMEHINQFYLLKF